MLSRYTQSHAIFYLKESLKSTDFMLNNLAVNSYIERVTVLTQTKAKNFRDLSNFSLIWHSKKIPTFPKIYEEEHDKHDK